MRILPLILAFGLISVTSTSLALPEDEQQAAQLAANTADINQKSHHGEYIGDVQFDQGTRHLRADKAITESDERNKLVEARVFGNASTRAHYWELTAKDKPEMHAYANEIHYYAKKNKIELIGNAEVTQGDDRFAAPKIIYDTVTQHITTMKMGTERTTIIIHPSKKNA